jgi:uncharacterized membrane protein YkoI
MLRRKWVIPVATLVLTLSIGSAAFAATGSSSTDTTAAVATATTAASMVTTAADNGSTTATSTASDASTTAGTTAQKAPDSSKPWGNQRSDETLQTGDILAKLSAAAQAKVSGGTVVRVETDADGNAKYEVHMVKADGTLTTVYFDASLNFVKVIDGGGGGNHAGRPNDNDQDDNASSATSTAAGSTSASTGSSSTSTS